MNMAEMNILVCVKQVPDPEGPPSAFEVDSAAKKVTPKGIPPVLSPFDENALEAAIRVKGSGRRHRHHALGGLQPLQGGHAQGPGLRR